VVNSVEPRMEHGTLATRTAVICDVLILLTLMGIAAALRLYGLDSLPPGFDVDEAYNMLDALDIIRGKHPVFLPANAGREALYSYLQALMVLILGKQVFALRLTSALIGIATVGATYAFVSSLPVCRARTLALLTALLLALSFYHLTFSRYGIRSIMTPLVECLAFYAYWRGCQAVWVSHWRSWISFAWAGFWLGIGLYAHTAARLVPLIPIGFTGYLILRDRQRIGRYLGSLIVLLLAMAIVSLPLVNYFWTHPYDFTGHVAEVSILNSQAAISPDQSLARNALLVLGMFNWQGDLAWSRNLSGRPVFDPLMSIFFLMGLLLLIRDAIWHSQPLGKGGVACFTLLWIGVMLLPTLLAEDAPSFSRAIGILPAVYMPPALALLTISRRISTWGLKPPTKLILEIAVIVTVVLVSGAWTVYDYFVVFARNPNMAYDYDQDKVDAAQYIRKAVAEGHRVYLSPFLASHSTVRVLTADLTLASFDGHQGLVLPPADGERKAIYVFMAAWEPESATAFGRELGDLASPKTMNDTWGRPLVTVYEIDAANLPESTDPIAALKELGYQPRPVGDGLFADRIELLGYVLDRPLSPGQTVAFTLFWRTRQRVPYNYTVFVHVVDTADQRWGQHDKPPLGGSYPTNVWRVNEVIVDHYELAIDPNPPSGSLRILVGLYIPQTGARAALSSTGQTHIELPTE
jgi:hypothetical protein